MNRKITVALFASAALCALGAAGYFFFSGENSRGTLFLLIGLSMSCFTVMEALIIKSRRSEGKTEEKKPKKRKK